MPWRAFQFVYYMVPIFWDLLKDLIWEDLSLGEIQTNYLFSKANAYDQALFLRRAVRVYKAILRRDPN